MFNWTPKYPLKKKWFILIFARPGHGKSLEQARLSYYAFEEYHLTEWKYPKLPHRILLTNQKLNDYITEKEVEHGHLLYWENPDDLRYCPRSNCFKYQNIRHRLHDADIFIDEGSTLFPADSWSLTPMWIRKLWSQHRHNGIRIVMLTQDYKGVDINCRRMLGAAYQMKKRFGSRDISPTLPELYKASIWNILHPRRSVIWGIYTKQFVSPEMLEADGNSLTMLPLYEEKISMLRKVRMLAIPRIHAITSWKCGLYDTTQDIKESEMIREYEHIEGKCEKINCDFVHKTHRLK